MSEGFYITSYKDGEKSKKDQAVKEQEEKREVSASERPSDRDVENVLRPKTMDGYVGQKKIKENLAISIEAAKMRSEALDHVLLYGPPGLGKTTLAHIVANTLGVNLKIASAPSIERAADLAAIITNLGEHDVLFIDEIHRLNRSVEEILYSAMEDYVFDFISGKGPSASIVRIPLPHFTLIGATTKAGMLSSPLRDRFGVILRLENYSVEELCEIVERSAKRLDFAIDKSASTEIAKRSRGTPRIANRLLKRVRDFSTVNGHNKIQLEDAKDCLSMLGIDELGLDEIDNRLLRAFAERFHGGPCGLDTLADTVNEDAVTIEDVYEPYLLQLGFIARTPRGRILLKNGYLHVGLKPPENFYEQQTIDVDYENK